MKYKVEGIEKRAFMERVAELSGQKMVYGGVPRCAYTLPGIVLERDLTLLAEDGADMELIGKLLEEGLLREIMEEARITVTEEAEEEEAEEAETEAADLCAEPEEEAEPETPETEEADLCAETEEEAEPETSETEEEETEEEETEEGETEQPSGRQTEDTEPLTPSISFPLSKHRAESVCNLVYTLYSKGELLSKATGGRFEATKEIVDALKAKNLLTLKDALEVIEEAGAEDIIGLTIADDKVTFDGFPATDDAGRIKAWTELAAAINKTAIKQNHVQARKTEEPNEKFAFRTWMTRLGMNGAELKAERNLLYQNLSGHTAFRTQADAEKWKARYGNKRKEKDENGAEE